MSRWADEVKQVGERMLDALVEMRRAEHEYNQRKDEYEALQRQVAEAMRMNGIEDIGTDTGYRLVVVEKAHCTINKNPADRENVARWMEAQGFDAKVKRSARVAQSSIDALRSSGIPFMEELDINTNSVKAVIKELLSSGQLNIADIPQGCNYYQEDVVEVRT